MIDADEFNANLGEGNFLKLLPDLVVVPIQEALQAIEECGYGVTGTIPSGPFEPRKLVPLVARLADETQKEVAKLGEDAPEKLEAASMTLTSVSLLLFALTERVPADLNKLARYRAHMIVVGWLGGLMYRNLGSPGDAAMKEMVASAVSEHMAALQGKSVNSRTPWRGPAREYLRPLMERRPGLSHNNVAKLLEEDAEFYRKLQKLGVPDRRQVATWVQRERTDPNGLPPRVRGK